MTEHKTDMNITKIDKYKKKKKNRTALLLRNTTETLSSTFTKGH